MKKIIIIILIMLGDLMAQQKSNLSITEQLAYSTVKIQVQTSRGTGVGTGFFYDFEFDNNQHIPVIITNKHVVKDAQVGAFLLSSVNDDGTPNNQKHIPVGLNEFEKRWIQHPDSNIDLTLMPLAPLLNEASEKGVKPFLIPLSENLIPSDEQLKGLTAVEDILMVGYPIGLWDEKNNYPLYRKGITSTHPMNDYNGKSEFVIDAACFPGSSGSPVFLANIGNYVDKKGNTIIATRFLLLGILYAGPQYSAEGEIKVIDIPTKRDTVAVSEIPMNLGYVIKSKNIKSLKPILERLMKK